MFETPSLERRYPVACRKAGEEVSERRVFSSGGRVGEEVEPKLYDIIFVLIYMYDTKGLSFYALVVEGGGDRSME